MCLLIYAMPNHNIPVEHLREAAASNPDGFGFAIRTRKRIITHRTMEIDDAIERWNYERTRNMSAHALFHLRITTHGGTNVENCHPFIVEDGVVLAHNGMLPIKEKEGMSDTRQFATEWLPYMGVDVLDDPDEFSEIERFAQGSKMVILSNSDKLSKPLYMVNERDGHWNNGIWYSNYSYEPYVPTARRGGWNNYPTTYAYGDKDLSDDLANGWYYDNQTGCWTDGDSDIEGWVCQVCDHTEWYDLSIDHPEACEVCHTCWYCQKSLWECSCELAEG